jgi:hypothetical protein
MPVVSEWRRCKEYGPEELAIEAVAVGIAKVAGVVRFALVSRSAEQPEEAGILVGWNRQPVLTTGLGGSLSDGLPGLCPGSCADNLDTVAEMAVRPGELYPTSLLNQSKRWGLSHRRYKGGR